MSWLMIESMESYHNGYMQAESQYEHFSELLTEHVTAGAKIRRMAKTELLANIQRLREQVKQKVRDSAPPFDRQKLWEAYLSVGEIPWALWASQRLAYGSLYYGYENFLQRAIELGKGDDEYRAYNPAELKRDFTALFGAAMATECLDDPDIEIARRVRNALTHDGGRESVKLHALHHGIRISDGQLHIFPEDVQKLFGLLKERVLKVANAAKSVSAFTPAPRNN
jgi:hypothetical protein